MTKITSFSVGCIGRRHLCAEGGGSEEDGESEAARDCGLVLALNPRLLLLSSADQLGRPGALPCALQQRAGGRRRVVVEEASSGGHLSLCNFSLPLSSFSLAL